MLMNAIAVTSVLVVTPFAQVEPEPVEKDQPVESAVKEVPETPPRPEPLQPLIGPREKLAMRLLRQLVPIERQRDYDDAVTILESVATTVDQVRERRGEDRRRPAFQSRRREDRREAASSRDAVRARRDAEIDAGIDEGAEALAPSFRGRNGNVFETLMKKRRELQEAIAREQAERRQKEQEQPVREQPAQSDGPANDDREDDDREIERETEHQHSRARQNHGNPFRTGRSGDGPDEPGNALRDRDEHARRSAEAHAHDHGAHDHPHPGHRPGMPMNRQSELERAERDAHALQLDAARLELAVERSQLRARSVADPEVTAIWAVERLIEVFGNDAPNLLAELKDETESPIVRRFITVRLAELAGGNRQAAVEALSELVIADD